MKRDEVARYVAAKTGVSIAASERVTQEVFNTILEAVADGVTVQIRGFGTFTTKARAQRIGRDTRTKEPIVIPSRVIPQFTPSPVFKEKVNKAQGG